MCENEVSVKKDVKELALDFLFCCYFGRSDNLIKGAIDRAYVDMASHTLKIDDVKVKWGYRYDASKMIEELLEKYSNYSCFDVWHKELVLSIEEIYVDKLQNGQAEKWINMTIKYLFVLKTLLGSKDKRLSGIKDFLTNTSENDYKIPIDSYVLKGAGIKNVTWSKLDQEDYSKIQDMMGEYKVFLWELTMLESFSKEYAQDDKNSYARYYAEREEDKK